MITLEMISSELAIKRWSGVHVENCLDEAKWRAHRGSGPWLIHLLACLLACLPGSGDRQHRPGGWRCRLYEATLCSQVNKYKCTTTSTYYIGSSIITERPGRIAAIEHMAESQRRGSTCGHAGIINIADA